MAFENLICQVPVGMKGLVTDLAPSAVPFDALTKVINCDYQLGFMQKAPGAITYNRTAFSAGVVALFDYWPTTVKQRLFAATSDGKIYKDTGDRYFGGNAASTSPVAIATGLGALTSKCQFVQGGNETSGRDKKIFFFSGGLNQVKVCSGDNSTFASISSPAADWPNPSVSSNPQSNFPNFGLIHRGRLVCFAKSNCYMSLTSDHEDFTSTGNLSFSVGPGEGGDIVGAFVYKQKLIVWKDGDFSYILNDSDTTTSNWYFSKFGEGLGVAGWHACAQVLDDLILGSNTNKLVSFSATLNYGNFTQGDIFKRSLVSRFFAENTVPLGSQYQQALYYPEKGLAYFTGRTKGGTANNCIIQLDVSHPETPKFELLTHLSPDCLALRRDTNNIQRPIYGAADGYVYLMDREDRAVGVMGSGSAYTGEFWTAEIDMRHLDPGFAHKNKLWQNLGVTFQEEGSQNLSIDVWIDGRFSETITFLQTVDTNYCGAFVLGTSKLGGFGEKTLWKPLHGVGRRIMFRCYNSGSNQNFKVSMLTVGFELSGEQPTRLS